MTRMIVSQNVKRTGEGLYSVASEARPGMLYTVDLKANSCQCPHFLHRLQGKAGGDCKHITAAKARVAEVAAAKARSIPDVAIDELAAKYENERPEISTALYDEIRRRGAEHQEAMLKALFQ